MLPPNQVYSIWSCMVLSRLVMSLLCVLKFSTTDKNPQTNCFYHTTVTCTRRWAGLHASLGAGHKERISYLPYIECHVTCNSWIHVYTCMHGFLKHANKSQRHLPASAVWVSSPPERPRPVSLNASRPSPLCSFGSGRGTAPARLRAGRSAPGGGSWCSLGAQRICGDRWNRSWARTVRP